MKNLFLLLLLSFLFSQCETEVISENTLADSFTNFKPQLLATVMPAKDFQVEFYESGPGEVNITSVYNENDVNAENAQVISDLSIGYEELYKKLAAGKINQTFLNNIKNAEIRKKMLREKVAAISPAPPVNGGPGFSITNRRYVVAPAPFSCKPASQIQLFGFCYLNGLSYQSTWCRTNVTEPITYNMAGAEVVAKLYVQGTNGEMSAVRYDYNCVNEIGICQRQVLLPTKGTWKQTIVYRTNLQHNRQMLSVTFTPYGDCKYMHTSLVSNPF